MQTVARSVDTARTFKVIGDAWNIYANSKEGKQYLQESGKGLADFLTQAGFTLDTVFDNFKADARKRAEVIEARNWKPAIEEELDALLEDIEAEEQLAEINQQEAQEPTIIPAEESITGQEITIDPAPSSEQETLVTAEPDSAANLTGTKATTILSHMRDLIAKGKARAEHFAITFREIPGLTEAQAIEQGIRPLTQRGEPTAAYTQGKLLAERCTDAQYLLLKSGKLTQKAKRDILGAPTQTRRNPAWPKREKKGITPAVQRLTIIKALQNAVDYAAENPNYNLNFTRHIISKGREYYVATDGRRLAVIERTAPKGSKDIEESLDKNGNVVKDAKFPASWRQVMIALTDKAQTLDLAPFRYLETYPKTAINHVVWQDSEGKLSKYNPNYIGKGIKFFSTLSKAIGSPSTIQVDNQNMGPILMQSDHDGWTAKYLLMPMLLVDGDIYKEGDILLNPQQDGNVVTFSINAGTPSIELTSIATNRDEAEKILIARNVFNKPLLYKGEENYATALSKNGFRKLTDSHMTKKKLVPLGYTVAEAQTIHMTAVAHIDILFENAYNAKPEAPYHGEGRESVPHLYSNFRIPGFVDEFTANITLLVFTDKNNGNKLYALRVEIQSPDKLRVPAEDNSANGRSIGAEGTIAQNAEDVNSENQTTANFSIKPAAADTLDRFTVDHLGERIVHTVRTEARRYARALGDKTPQEQAMNAIASAESIIMAVDKYLHRPDKPVSRRHRNQLTKLRSIIEKYAQIISGGTPRSFKRISPAEQQELQDAIAELEAAELDTATTESDQILTDSDRLTKREAAARQKEHQIFTKPSVRRRSAALTTRARMWYDAEQSIWTWTSSNLPPANSRYSRARRNAMPSSAALCATTTSSTTPRLSRKSQMPSMISSTGK